MREYKKKNKFLLLEVAWRLRRPSLARLLHHHNSSSRAAASNFGAALHDIARRVFKGKKRKEKVFKTLCWRRCCCCGRYLTELERLISGNSMRHSYASTSSLSHLDFYGKVCNTSFFNHHNQKQLYPPPSADKHGLILAAFFEQDNKYLLSV